MHPIHDVDVLLLLATALAAKRRPAEASEIMAAADLIQGRLPSAELCSAAFARLGAAGLLVQTGDRLALTAAAERLIAELPAKGDHAARLLQLAALLGAYRPQGDGTAVDWPAAQLVVAMQAHRAAAASKAKNLLIPKPKPESGPSRPGQRRRKPMPKRRKD